MEIKGLTFVKTCNCCPEQYEVYRNGKHIGYVRLRWGTLTCEYPDLDGELVYCVDMDSDIQGEFNSDKERMFHLEAIADKLLKADNKTRNKKKHMLI